MVPGYLAGRYHEDEIAFDLPGLAASAGARFVSGRVTGVSSSRSIVSLEDGRDLPFDLLSLCLGSGVAGAGTPGVSRWAASVKPIHRARETRERLLAVAGKGTGTRSGDVAVVGAGSAGVEIACAAARVLADRQSRGRVHLLDRGRLLPEGTDAEREALRRILAARGVSIREGTLVTEVREADIQVGDRESVASALTIWATGPAAPALLRASGLPVDGDGYLLVDRFLHSVADPRVFAAGDCATLAGGPGAPRAGVLAVREGPVLVANLFAAAAGSKLRAFSARSTYLSILDTSDGRGFLRFGPLFASGRWALAFKTAIDRRFVRRYRIAPLSGSDEGDETLGGRR